MGLSLARLGNWKGSVSYTRFCRARHRNDPNTQLASPLSLVVLDLAANVLQGTIPSSLSNLKHLGKDMRAFMKPKIGVTIGYCDLGVFGQHLSNCLFCPDKVVVAGNRLHGSVPSVWCSQMGLVGVQDIGCTLEAPPCCDDCLEYCHLGHSKKGG